MTVHQWPIIIGVTGHRKEKWPDPVAARRRVREVVAAWHRAHPGALWLSGGAAGVDLWALEVLTTLDTFRRVFLPLPVDNHLRALPSQERDHANDLLWQANHQERFPNDLVATVIPCNDFSISPIKAAYAERNNQIARRSNVLLAFTMQPGGGQTGSGQTIRMAQRAGTMIVDAMREVGL
ncbi:MAG: hypothetical protein HY816_20145 [Candidatus Wallbacteria bacterium]|nr:hypothetical protein [Candidatus Wallbacteria bacterium]